MLVNSVKVNLGRTISLGNFEFTRIDVEFGAIIPPGGDHLNAADELYRMAESKLEELLNPTPKPVEQDLKDDIKLYY